MDGPWNLPRYREQIQFDWGVAPLPAGSAARVTYLSGEYLVIFRRCQQPEAAWRFIRWFLEPEVQKKFAQQSGYLPVIRSLQRESDYTDYLKTYPQQRIFNEQVQWSRGRELPERYRVEVNQKLAGALEMAILGERDAHKALAAAEEQIVQLLKSE